jgi:hypothetical protein
MQKTQVGRLKAASLHLCGSLVVASLSAALIFFLWFPGEYRAMAGGQDLFFLIVSVDVVLGPLLTFAVFNKLKPWAVLRRDLLVILALQLAALFYGTYTLFLARPVAMVFESTRFRMVTAVQVVETELPQALPSYRHLSWTGPLLLGTREPVDADEQFKALELGLNGFDVGLRPSFWSDYETSVPDIKAAARPVALLQQKYPDAKVAIDEVFKRASVDPQVGLFFPVIARKEWVMLMSPEAKVLGYLMLDGFF